MPGKQSEKKGNGVDWEEKCGELAKALNQMEQEKIAVINSASLYMSAVNQRASAEDDEGVALKQLALIMNQVTPKQNA